MAKAYIHGVRPQENVKSACVFDLMAHNSYMGSRSVPAGASRMDRGQGFSYERHQDRHRP